MIVEIIIFRLWWIIAVGLALWWCGLMIQEVVVEWNDHPTKYEFTEKIHVSAIPFPTVTICSFNKNIKQKLDITSKFSDKHNILIANLSQTE